MPLKEPDLFCSWRPCGDCPWQRPALPLGHGQHKIMRQMSWLMLATSCP